MSNIVHSTLAGAELHVPGYAQNSDPGAVGAGKYWINTTTTGEWALKVRNTTNTGWELVADPAIGSTQITAPGKVSGAALTLLNLIPPGAGVIPIVNLPAALQLQSDVTVNLTASMTTAQIQALIDAQPKNLGGRTLTFQFADGTYATTAALSFANFYSGTLALQGNMSEPTTNHTNQAVIIDSSGTTLINTIEIQRCVAAKVSITNIATKVNTSVGPGAGSFLDIGIYTNECPAFIQIMGCYSRGTSVTYGYAFMFKHCSVIDIQECWLATVADGIAGFGTANIHSTLNQSVVGAYPNYGERADASCIRRTTTQPQGLINATRTTNDGTYVG